MKYEATTSQTRKMGILAAMIALMTIVYVFGASPYAGTFGTLQAQGGNGAITGLTLTSDTPGTLTVSWGTRPAPRPLTTGSTGPRPARTTNHGRSTKATNIQPPPPRP